MAHWLALLVVLALTNAIDFVSTAKVGAGVWLVVGLAMRVIVIFYVFVATLRVLTTSPRLPWSLDGGTARYIGLAIAQLALGVALAVAFKLATGTIAPMFAAIPSIVASLVGLRFVLLFVDAAHGAPFTPRAAWSRLEGRYVPLAATWMTAVLPLFLVHFALTLYAVDGGLAFAALLTLALVDGMVSALIAAVMLSLHAAIWLETRSNQAGIPRVRLSHG